jgi:hypothetical protein
MELLVLMALQIEVAQAGAVLGQERLAAQAGFPLAVAVVVAQLMRVSVVLAVRAKFL